MTERRPSFEPEERKARYEPPAFVTPPEPTPAEDTETCSTFTRRRFLAALGGSVAVAVAGGYGISVWGRSDAAQTAALPTSTVPTTLTTIPPGTLGPGPFAHRTLVVVEMGGGNDGLNTVVPFSSDAYYDMRRGLAIEEPIDLDGEVGLHPNLGFVADQYRAGRLAIVEGVGYPNPDLSHFASMSNWWSGIPTAVGATGWLGRYLDGMVGTDDPLAGVSIGPGPTPALAGERSFAVAIQDVSGLAPSVPRWMDNAAEVTGMWQGFAPAPFDSTLMIDQVRAAIDATVNAAGHVNDALGHGNIEQPTEAGQRADIVQSLEIAAALIGSPNPPRVIYIHGWGDFDTHEGQASKHGQLMTDLDEGFAAFFGKIDELARDVLVMTTSEFGRRVASNGSGTDHGTAGSQLLIGSTIASGRFGESPNLKALDVRGNLIHTVDYRSVYASVLEGFLEVPAAEILGSEFETLPVFEG